MSNEIPEHEHDDEGNCVMPEGYTAVRSYPLNPYGLLYNGTVLLANVAQSLTQFFFNLSTDLSAANNDLIDRRQRAAYQAYQRQEAEHLAAMASYVQEREDTP